jgi:ribosomal protein S18 acetylase RimI-like enzyme
MASDESCLICFYQSAPECNTHNMTDSGDFSIRAARPQDYPALLDLSPRLAIGVAPWRDPAKVACAAREWIGSSLASAGEHGHAVLVALLGGQVAGMVSLAEREHFTGEVDAYVSELAVDRAMEGRGAGRALMAAAEQWAAAQGLTRITLETGARNHRARHFYEEAGYQEEEVRLTKAVAPRQ